MKYKITKSPCSGQHHPVQYSVNDETGEGFLEEYIDATSDSRKGKSIQKIVDILFITGKIPLKTCLNYRRDPIEEYSMTSEEMKFYRILSKLANRSVLSRSKQLEELAALSKKEIEERLILLKIVGGK